MAVLAVRKRTSPAARYDLANYGILVALRARLQPTSSG